MTNHWVDLKNTDVALIIGSNAAENHPMSFKWLQKGKEERGTIIIHVDPRYTRTSAKADIWAPIRSSTDIAFISGIINYALTKNRINREYVRYYTNGAFLVNPNFDFDTVTGQFAGFNGTAYADKSSWQYQTDQRTGADGAVEAATPARFQAPGAAFTAAMVGRKLSLTSGAVAGTYAISAVVDAQTVDLTGLAAAADEGTISWVLPGVPLLDETMEDENCVLQVMKRHFARYDAETVYQVTGCSPKDFYAVAEAFTSTAAEDRVGTIMYAMGTTQHTHGTQNIRSYAILQLLMGNIGLAGGGINAMRGESNVQGSTDMALLYHIIPGYLKVPTASHTTLGIDPATALGIVHNQDQYSPSFRALTAEQQAAATASFLWNTTPATNDPRSANWWSNTPKYMVSLLKAWWGDHATSANEFAFHNLPKIDPATNYSHMSLFEAMANGVIKGLFCFGQNPAVGGPNAEYEREALGNLDWLVCVDLWETETSTFWKRPKDIDGNPVDPTTIDTEVWQLPAAGSYEKEGSVANSGRWAQWRYKAVEPPGEAMDDAWIISKLIEALKASPPAQFPEGIQNLTWDYWGEGDHIDISKVAKEVNGQNVADGTQVTSFSNLKFDGSTTSGNWLYCGAYVNPADDASAEAYDGNRMRRRDNANASDVSGIGLYANWSWCWPVNRRIIYNRASLRPDTQEPWDPSRAVILVDQNSTSANYKKPIQGDVPDGGWVTDPAMAGYRHPFIMKPEGHSRLFGMGLADGPLPEHYEPMESPLTNSVVNGATHSPAVYIYPGELGQFADSADFPYVGTTYRVTEHWQAGAMTRSIPWLGELMPYMFIEISHELAEAKGIKSGDQVIVTTPRGSVTASAVVTWRIKPMQVAGQTVHQVGVPWHWGYAGLFTGDSGNSLTPHVGDVNTRIPEFKAFLCNLNKA